jgi:hypothetical protein
MINPWPILAAVLVFGAGLASGIKLHAGQVAREQVKAEQAAQRDQLKRMEASYGIGQRLAEQSAQGRTVTQTILKEVPVYVPNDSCALPGGFRRLHDAAARRENPSSATGDVQAVVPAQDVANTIAENYDAHHAAVDAAEACRAYVLEVVRPAGMTGSEAAAN